jgi:GDPmannose 4,6-dehydratase
MYLMLQQDDPGDYVIATGESYSLADFVAQAFECLGLDWQDHVVTDASLYRPTDITWGGGNPKLAEEKLGWRAEYEMSDVVRMMVEDRVAASTPEN